MSYAPSHAPPHVVPPSGGSKAAPKIHSALPNQTNGAKSSALVRMAPLLLFVALMTACGNSGLAPAPPAASPPPASDASGSDTNAVVETNLATTAAFDPLGTGKDPFFPTSGRAPSPAVATNGVEIIPQLPLSAYLRLTGLMPNRARPLAIINDTIFEPGETASVSVMFPSADGTLAQKSVSVICREIRSDSVSVTVEGELGVKKLELPKD